MGLAVMIRPKEFYLTILSISLLLAQSRLVKSRCIIDVSKATNLQYGKIFEVKMESQSLIFKVERTEAREERYSFLVTHSKTDSELVFDGDYPEKYQGMSICGRVRVTGFFKDGFFHGIVDINKETYLIEENENGAGKNTLKTAMIPIEKPKDTTSYGLNATTIATRLDIRKINDVKCPQLNETTEKYQTSRQSVVQKILRLCTVELIADHTFYREFGPDREQVVAKMFRHISLADTLLRRTDFDGNGVPDGIGLVVRKVTVFRDDKSQNYHLKGPVDNQVAESFLYDVAKSDNNVCLAITFCHRLFQDKTVGVAFIPNIDDPSQYGGICEKRVKFPDNWYRKTNVVVISTKMSTGKRVPDALTSSTVIHEIGHAFGSLHDDRNSGCSPDADQGGAYIMHPHTLQGSGTNNFYFSTCSTRAMSRVIRRRKTCFEKYPSRAFCGNGVKEEGEECDCGISEVCHMLDHCCNPPQKDPLVKSVYKGCTYKRHLGYQCSFKTDPCCADDCRLEPITSKRQCNYRVGLCSYGSVCDGQTAACVGNTSRNDSCEAASCVRAGLKTCLCPEDDCKVCCLSKKGVCGYYIDGTSSVNLPNGAICAGGKGTCNASGKCTMPSTEDEGLTDNIKLLIYVTVALFIITILTCVCFCCCMMGKICNLPYVISERNKKRRAEFDKNQG